MRVTVRPHGDRGAEEPQVTGGSHPMRQVLPAIALRLDASAPIT